MRRAISLIGLIVSLLAAPAYATTLLDEIESRPGELIEVPIGTHEIDRPIVLTSGAGLVGHGTIIQTNPEADIVRVSDASGVLIESVTLTRPEGSQVTERCAVWAEDVRDLTLRNVTIRDNKSDRAAVWIRRSVNTRIEGCEIINYKRLTIDDRTHNPEWGYAFNAIDGDGIQLRDSTDAFVINNRVIEYDYLPTREIWEREELGMLTDGAHPTVTDGEFYRRAVRDGRVQAWHQGSAILVSGPKTSRHITLQGNIIQNSAQGFDIHADKVNLVGNTVNHGMMGVKITHGARNVLVANNTLTHIDLWGILLNPGAVSHYASGRDGDREAVSENVDRGTLITGNIITDFGYGHEWWNWSGNPEGDLKSHAIALFEGQVPENPPLRDVVISNNIVYDSGRDGVIDENGKLTFPDPRYRYAVYVGVWVEEHGPVGETLPRDLIIRNNLLEPGYKGVSTIDIGR